MKSYLLVRIKTTQKNNLLLKLNKLDVDIKNISYENESLNFLIRAEDLAKLKKYLLSYKVEIITETGLFKLKKELKKNNLIITGLLFGLIIFLILSNLIVKINVIHEDADLRELITLALAEEGLTPLSFKKSYDEYEQIIANIKEQYQDQIEWLEIDIEGMVANIRVEERIINDYEENYNTCHIIADKAGIIKSIVTNKGILEVSINDYVQKGDILINGSISLNDEIKKNVCASGKIYAEVWYQVNASLPMVKEVSKDTNKMRYNFMIKTKTKTKETVLLKSRIDGEKRVENKLLFSLFGFEFYLQKEYEVIKETYEYTPKEAEDLAIKLIEEKLALKLDDFEEIIEQKVLQKYVKNNNIYIDMFIAVKEQIGVTQYFDESRSDTNDTDDNNHSN